VAVFTLALGIGAVTIIYSVINNVLFDPLPYPNSDRLVNVLVKDLATGRSRGSIGASEFLDFQQGADAFEDVIGAAGVGMLLSGPERSEFLRAVWVTPNFFDFMGLPPLMGRTAGSADGRPDATPVAVLRHRAWINVFGADPGIVGKTIVLNGAPYTVVGVMPPRFTWHAADVWIPRPIDRAAPPAPASRNFQARLKPHVTTGQAATQLGLIAARRAREHPADYPEKFQVDVVNVIEFTVGGFSRVLYTTLAAVGLLLLIACCNVANMLLARATVREREMTVRAALGAGRGRIVRQLLVESLLLGVSGGALGCLLAYAGLDALVALLPQSPLPGEVEIAIDRAALVFSFGTAVASALLFGIAPALYSARRDLVGGLKAGRGIAGGRGYLRNALVAAEIALSLVLLLSAGLLMRSFVSIVRIDLGFNPENILWVPLAFAPESYADPTEKARFYEQALERIAALPGVEAASASTSIPPYNDPFRTELQLSGTGHSTQASAILQSCSKDHFRTLGIRILRGRGFTARAAGEPPTTAVVNHTLVATYFKDADPIGETLTLSPAPTGDGRFEIVGVVEDIKNQGLTDATAPQVFIPGAVNGRGTPFIFVRTLGDPRSVLPAVRDQIASVDRQVALRQPATLQSLIEQGFYSQPRFSLIVFSLFAVTGAVLVAIGVFSAMAYNVSRQTKEIAVRMALGAARRHVWRVVFRLGLQLLVAGAAVGLLASVVTSRLIVNQLWNTSPYDPLTLVAATAVIAVVALAACYLPARRAMAVDPMTALRHD
jgi:putative ABC transport system permease protein